MPEPRDQSPASPYRSATSVTVDNLIRRALRVSDPQDPSQLAKALLDRFAGDAEQLRRERAGAAVLRPQPTPLPVLVEGAGQLELGVAQADRDRGLDALSGECPL
jgi:hypothetical protein